MQPEPVVIEDDVEIQANSCIDRASVEKTRIGRGTKIDNLVQVGHGSRIGEHSLLASQVGLAGSTEIGNNVILTGQVGVVGHCKVGDGAIVTPQSGVAGDIEAGAIVSGAPAVDHKLVAEVFGTAEQACPKSRGPCGLRRRRSRHRRTPREAQEIASFLHLLRQGRCRSLCLTFSISSFAAAKIFRFDGRMEGHGDSTRLDGEPSFGHHVMRT